MKVNESSAEINTQELGWLQQLLLWRGKIFFEQFKPKAAMEALMPLSIENISSPYANLIQKHQIGIAKRGVLILEFQLI